MKRYHTRPSCRLLAVLAVLAILVGCSAAESGSAPDGGYAGRPAMWEVTAPDSGNTIYLFGSIHAAEETLYPMNREILDIFESCDALAVEVDILPYTEDPIKAMELSQYMLYLDGSSITDEIDEELFSQILEVLEAEEVDLGVPYEYATMFRPYTFISLLTQVAVERADLSAEQGVDMYFLQLAREREMEVLEIEDMTSQMEMFNSFSPDLNTHQLQSALLLDEEAGGVRALYDAWKTGDVDALAATPDEPADAPDDQLQQVLEEYNQALVDDRNIWMSDVAEDYLEQGKRVFYVVGALHMVGDDGIVQQLTDRGYTVNRI